MSDEQLAKAQGVIHVPTCLGAVVLAFNLEGVTKLNLIEGERKAYQSLEVLIMDAEGDGIPAQGLPRIRWPGAAIRRCVRALAR